jgi:hypothetical protein
LAYGSYQININDLEAEDQRPKEISNDMKNIYSLCFLSDNTLAVGNVNGAINIFSLDTKKKIHRVEGIYYYLS